MRRLKRPYMRYGIMLPPIYHDISGERLDGTFPVFRSGYNADIAATWETVYADSSVYTWPGAAAQLDVLSSNGNDDGAPAGTGARTVYIWGLNGSFKPVNETITMNGVTAVLTVNSYLRVQGMRVVTAGAAGPNVGNIAAQDQANTYSMGYMSAGYGRFDGAYWTVPEGKTLYITRWYAGEVAEKITEFAIFAREPGGVFKAYCKIQVRNELVDFEFDCPLRFDEKTDIEIMAQAAGAAGNGCAGFHGWYEPSEGNLTQDR